MATAGFADSPQRTLRDEQINYDNKQMIERPPGVRLPRPEPRGDA